MVGKQLSEEFIEDSSSDAGSQEDEIPSGSQGASKSVKLTNGMSSETTKKSQRKSVESSASSDDSDAEGTSSSERDALIHSHTSSEAKRKSTTHANDARPTKKRARQINGEPDRIPSRDFDVPASYKTINMSPSDFATDATAMFDAANSPDQQVWHITAPASVPISSIKNLDMQAALRGEVILQHKGVSYNMQSMPDQKSTLLLPHLNTDRTTVYKNATINISRNLYLREMAQAPVQAKHSLPSHPISQETQPSETVSTPIFFASETRRMPPPRKQPLGLLMRYHPYGSRISNPGKMQNPNVEDDEEEQRMALEGPTSTIMNGFRVPDPIDAGPSDDHTRAEKRRKEKKSKDKPKSGSNTKKSSKSSHKDSHSHSSTDKDMMDINGVTETLTNGASEVRSEAGEIAHATVGKNGKKDKSKKMS